MLFYVFYDAFEAVMNGLSGWMGAAAVALLCVAGLVVGLLVSRRRRGGDRA